jgi:putative transposase
MAMRRWKNQSHVRWYCRYHVVIVPKYRRKSMFGTVRLIIGNLIKEVSSRYGVEIIEGHVLSDHIHMCMELPPKFSVSEFIGKLKGKTTILLHQRYGRKKNFRGLNFWSRGYCVSTVGLKEADLLDYIRSQEEREKKEDQLELNV